MTKSLQSKLPYRLKPKLPPAPQVVEKRPKMIQRNTAVVLEPRESRINDLMQVLDTVTKDRHAQEKVDLQKRQDEYKKVCHKLN